MWSQCACDSRMLASPPPLPNGPPSSELPRLRAPVPQSRMTSLPALVRSDTHEVLPPKRTVPGPGADALALRRGLGLGQDRVDLGVGALGRVVEQHQLARARLAADLQRVRR